MKNYRFALLELDRGTFDRFVGGVLLEHAVDVSHRVVLAI